MKNIRDCTHEDLVDIFRNAREAADMAAESVADGGSCNLDSVQIYWPSSWGRVAPKQVSRVTSAMADAGVYGRWENIRWLKGWLVSGSDGIAARRTAWCEAFCRAVQPHMECAVHWVTD